MSDQHTIHPFDRLLAKMRKQCEGRPRDLGTAFELLVRDYLLLDKVQSSRYRAVQTYAEYARDHALTQQDHGIDLVATTHTGEYVAIQAKCYQPHRTIQKADIHSFISASGKSTFTERLICETTEGPWSIPAQLTLRDLLIPARQIGLAQFRNSSLDWLGIRGQAGRAQTPRLRPYPHQLEAKSAVVAGLAQADRGHMVMACGSGKTFTSLLIAEHMVGAHGTVLYLVPSLSLMNQSIQKWHDAAEHTLASWAVCSDSRVAKIASDDTPYVEIFEIIIPPTTDAQKLARSFDQHPAQSMRVVFCTYQSLDVIATAQSKHGLGPFDLVICDEAHRTTGATLAHQDESSFVKIHDATYIRASKRLYMTATPRIYGSNAKSKAESSGAVLASMDDEAVYGKRLFVMTFNEAVNAGLLTDYIVVILALKETDVTHSLSAMLSDESCELNLDDATKLLGCYRALNKDWQRPQPDKDGGHVPVEPMRRALCFTKDIRTSKRVAREFPEVIRRLTADFTLDVKHVDGTYNSKQREQLVSWLESTPTTGPVSRILTNARCLAEGVDIPALDAVIFLHPRKSLVDVVQAVGRVMRKAEGKQMGYVILPIGVPADISAEGALERSQKYKVVWDVLNALRAHDERLDAVINQRGLGQMDNERLVFKALAGVTAVVEDLHELPLDDHIIGVGEPSRETSSYEAALLSPSPPWMHEIEHLITAKMVEKCGTREYWDDWADSAAHIARAHITRINELIDPARHPNNHGVFQQFLAELRDDLNDGITEQDAVEMLAQHLITRPIFESLFTGHTFVDQNPVSKSMSAVLGALDNNGLAKETRDLSQFYHRIRVRSTGLTDPKAKQQLIVELYDKFFAKAFPRTVKMLGIAYTPVEIVDFMIQSVNELLINEFGGKTLGSPDVQILDPFTGTGTFITRLIESGLISPTDLRRKYYGAEGGGPEIHANEILLLAYYIAAINIETAYQGVMQADAYVPFKGICLTDTFGLHEKDDHTANFLVENSKRRTYQKSQDVQVIIGNPPYSVGQKNANDQAANAAYLVLDGRIAETYVRHATVNLTKSLYNSYIRAIRLGSDLITKSGGGVMALVTDAGWLASRAGAGLRKCVAAEFSAVYVFHLRGQARGLTGQRARQEGEGVFGQASRSPIALNFFIQKESGRTTTTPAIYFHKIKPNLSKREKLEHITSLGSLASITKKQQWQHLSPDAHGDWFDQRDPAYENLLLLGDKKQPDQLQVFELYSMGLKTNRDAWAYNPCKQQLLTHMDAMINQYNYERARLRAGEATSGRGYERARLRAGEATSGRGYERARLRAQAA